MRDLGEAQYIVFGTLKFKKENTKSLQDYTN